VNAQLLMLCVALLGSVMSSTGVVAMFITPVSSPVNTLALDPGRYRFAGFAKVGAPFAGVVLVVSVVLVPLVLPLFPR
jgi:di/tricarboxylate transporter